MVYLSEIKFWFWGSKNCEMWGRDIRFVHSILLGFVRRLLICLSLLFCIKKENRNFQWSYQIIIRVWKSYISKPFSLSEYHTETHSRSNKQKKIKSIQKEQKHHLEVVYPEKSYVQEILARLSQYRALIAAPTLELAVIATSTVNICWRHACMSSISCVCTWRDLLATKPILQPTITPDQLQ